jgi:hypothetical protein
MIVAFEQNRPVFLVFPAVLLAQEGDQHAA